MMISTKENNENDLITNRHNDWTSDKKNWAPPIYHSILNDENEKNSMFMYVFFFFTMVLH